SPSSRRAPSANTPSRAGVPSRYPCSMARRSGRATSSASWKAIQSPDATASPRLRAAARPPWAARTTRMRSPNVARTCAVSSVEPSPTTTTSPGGSVWPRMLSRLVAIQRPALKLGTTTEIMASVPRRDPCQDGRLDLPEELVRAQEAHQQVGHDVELAGVCAERRRLHSLLLGREGQLEPARVGEPG